MPNTVAYLVFFTYPLIAWILFRRLPVPLMIAATLVAGYLFLPTRVGFDLPLLPAIDRKFMPSLTAFMLLYFCQKQTQGGARGAQAHAPAYTVLEGWLPRNPIVVTLMGAFIVGTAMTVFFNLDPVVYGTRRLPALRLYDVMSSVLTILIVLCPFFLARRYLATPQAHLYLLLVLCLGGLVYSLPTLLEVRISPQLNKMVYGFFPTAWIQHLRSDGYRPVVFLVHGLHLGIFLTMTIIAAATLFRCAPKRRLLFLLAAGWLLATLFLAKTFGAFLIAIALLPIAVFLKPRLQVLGVSLIVIVVLTYPFLRGAGLVPVDAIVSAISDIDTQRAASLQFRLDNEEILLEKANQRPLFGWGGWGRSRVFDEDGNDIGTTDGFWLISLGLGGWVRYIAEFGLLSVSVLLLAFRKQKNGLGPSTAGLCMIMAANIIDAIPNAGITPVSWLIAGALAGRLEEAAKDPDPALEQDSADAPPGLPRGPRYNRQNGPPKQRQRPTAARTRAHPDTPSLERPTT